MELDYGQFVDLSNMTGDERTKLFPVLKAKNWRALYERFFIFFRYPLGYYGDEVDEYEDYYDGYGNGSDGRARWIKDLKEDGVTQQVFIDTLGDW